MIMKKVILLMAACVAVGTAFVACSSDDDLVQNAPVVPEENMDTPKGTPFSLSVSADTRATLYNADAWDGTDVGDGKWVSEIKIYGKQTQAATPWMKSAVFTRNAYDSDTWTITRDATSTSPDTPTWPVTDANATPATDSSDPTDFYAITDNAIGSTKEATISNVGAWMTTPGTFTYTMATTNGPVPHIELLRGTGYLDDPVENANYVDASELKDLMVAKATTTEPVDGKLTLPAFTHVLAGLNIKLIFRNDGVISNAQGNHQAVIHYIKIMGLNTSGTYNFNAAGTAGDPYWTGLSGADESCYYKEFASYQLVDSDEDEYDEAAKSEDVTAFPDEATLTRSHIYTVYKNESTDPVTYKKVVSPMTIPAVAENTTPAAADNNFWLVNKTDPWMVIPQKTTDHKWDGAKCTSNNYIEAGKVYIVLGITDDQYTDDVEVFLPLDTEFVAGTNKTLRLDLGQFRDLYADAKPVDGNADYYFIPSDTNGQARGYDFIDE